MIIGIVISIVVLIIIIIVVVVVNAKRINDLKENRAEDEKARQKLNNVADNIDIELTLDEEDELGYENLDDLTSQLRSVNMKLKQEIARLSEINVKLATDAG